MFLQEMREWLTFIVSASSTSNEIEKYKFVHIGAKMKMKTTKVKPSIR